MESTAESVAQTFKEFTYVVSHDLGTPLRAMVEFSRLLVNESSDELSDDARLYLSMVIENGSKAQAMLAGLLEYSRLNTVILPFSDTDCNRLVSECQSELTDKINATKATFKIDALPTVYGDTQQLKRLFRVLIENALTFRDKDSVPQINITVEPWSKSWVFSVRDNGIGIDKKFHDRIFQPFKRLHADNEYAGVGMGLALAKKIVSRHSGRIWVESEAGQGAVFKFAIPEAKVAA